MISKQDNNIKMTSNFPSPSGDLLKDQFSKETLIEKIKNLSPEERKELENLKKQRNLKTDEDVVEFLLSKIEEIAIPEDRAILSQPLMDKLSKLEKISYKANIKTFREHCYETTGNLYNIIMDTLRDLWVKKYEKEDAYRRFEIYQEFEKVLFKDPRYRDHFIHQFQVFLSGLPIIDKYQMEIENAYSGIFDSKIDIDFSWLLASTFHDIGYPVQQFDKWMNSFFSDFLDVKEIPTSIDLGKLLLIRNFQDYLDKLTSLYSALYQLNGGTHWKYNSPHRIDHELRRMFSSKLIEERNHGIISALILLDRIENSKIAQNDSNYIDTTFSSIVMPAALSIAMHDMGIFLSKNIEKIEFRKDPITFLIIYCDTIQEWGRPTSPIITDSENTPFLTKYSIDDEKVSVTLTYRKIIKVKSMSEEKTTFKLKEEEVINIFSKLKSNSPTFEITLQSNDKKHEYPERTYRSR